MGKKFCLWKALVENELLIFNCSVDLFLPIGFSKLPVCVCFCVSMVLCVCVCAYVYLCGGCGNGTEMPYLYAKWYISTLSLSTNQILILLWVHVYIVLMCILYVFIRAGKRISSTIGPQFFSLCEVGSFLFVSLLLFFISY